MSIRTKLRGLREIWAFDNRLGLIFNRVLFPSEPVQVYRFRGLEILTDHSAGDANAARDVLTSPMYRRFLPKMSLAVPLNILDLGASNGGFPLLLAAAGTPLRKVVCVELNPRTYYRLHYNLHKNLTCTVTAVNAAVAGRSGRIVLGLGRGGTSDSIYGSGENEYDLRVVTFDELYAEHFGSEVVDICKIDVEGAEFEIFASDTALALANCRYLIMEIHPRPRELADHLIEHIESLGLRLQEREPGADPSVHFFINSRF